MREQILELLHAKPFASFIVDIAQDVSYAILTPDHATAFPNQLVIDSGEGYVHIIAYPHIRRLITQEAEAN